MRSDLVVVSTPSLAFSAGLVEAEEPVGVQALRPKLAVQAFERVVGRFARPAEVECDTAHESPQIELPANELRPVIEPDRLRVTDLSANPFERLDSTAAAAIDRALALNPNSALAWSVRGWILGWQNRPDSAIEAHQQAIRLSPLDPL
jgi:tetratricopeptide (TPR) repeat protein